MSETGMDPGALEAQAVQSAQRVVEDLSQKEQADAGRLYREHKVSVEDFETWRQEANSSLDATKAASYKLNKMGNESDDKHVSMALWKAASDETAKFDALDLSFDDEWRKRADRTDANLWRAHQHKEEKLDKYTETARQEAEADGKVINLDPPKQPE